MEPFLLKEPKLRINFTEMIENLMITGPKSLELRYDDPHISIQKNMIASTDRNRRRNFQCS